MMRELGERLKGWSVCVWVLCVEVEGGEFLSRARFSSVSPDSLCSLITALAGAGQAGWLAISLPRAPPLSPMMREFLNFHITKSARHQPRGRAAAAGAGAARSKLTKTPWDLDYIQWDS